MHQKILRRGYPTLKRLTRSRKFNMSASRSDGLIIIHCVDSTLLFAGHDTTTNSVAWCFYEIARNPKCQERVRSEIAAMRAKKAGEMLSVTDFDGMTYTLATLKVCISTLFSLHTSLRYPFVSQESLRLHPVIHMMTRDATQDDVIPLSSPIITKSGEQVSSIEVRKGTPIGIAVSVYNR